MKNRVQYKKEPKIEICYRGIITIRLVTCKLPRVQSNFGTVFDKSDNVNSMGMLSSSKGIPSKNESHRTHFYVKWMSPW